MGSPTEAPGWAQGPGREGPVSGEVKFTRLRSLLPHCPPLSRGLGPSLPAAPPSVASLGGPGTAGSRPCSLGRGLWVARTLKSCFPLCYLEHVPRGRGGGVNPPADLCWAGTGHGGLRGSASFSGPGRAAWPEGRGQGQAQPSCPRICFGRVPAHSQPPGAEPGLFQVPMEPGPRRHPCPRALKRHLRTNLISLRMPRPAALGRFPSAALFTR